MFSECEENPDDKTDLAADSNRLNYEEERIKTFASWPIHYPVDSVRLAKAGFYYTGTDDEVVCFSCRGHIKNWNFGDIVLKKHSDLYPECDFIQNISNNVPLSKNSNQSVSKPCNNKISSNITQCDIDYEKMKSVNERMKTFNGKWTLTNVNIEDLAHAGYFYTGFNNKVQCAFCKVLVDNLKVSKTSDGEYLKHFSWCDHLSDQCRNYTTEVKSEKSWYKSSSHDVCGSMNATESNSVNISLMNKLCNNEQNVNFEDLGVYLHNNPVHPYYASLMTRVKTFCSWPANAPVSKEDLAVAGFFHLGVDDRTVCFYCNGGLKTWEAGDDPWVEHARWFSNCGFVRLNKGSDFVITCLLQSTSTFLNENHDSSGSDTPESLLKKLDEAMASSLVRSLLESGVYSSYILRATILLQIKESGNSFLNCDDLCVAASYLKDKMEQHYFNVKPIKADDLNICLKLSKNLSVSDTNEEPINTEQVSSQSLDISDEKNLNEGESFVIGAGALPEKPIIKLDMKEDHYLCKICMDRELGVVFLPCGHLPSCTICVSELKHCPICRKAIRATVRCYFH